MLAQDKFTQVNAVLGKRLIKCRSPVGAARTGQKESLRVGCFVSGREFPGSPANDLYSLGWFHSRRLGS